MNNLTEDGILIIIGMVMFFLLVAVPIIGGVLSSIFGACT